MKIFGLDVKEVWRMRKQSLAYKELYNNLFVPAFLLLSFIYLLCDNGVLWFRDGYSQPLCQQLVIIVMNIVLLCLYWRIVANVFNDKAFSISNVNLIKAAGLTLLISYVAVIWLNGHRVPDRVDKLVLFSLFTVAYFIYLLGSIIRIGIRMKAENDLTI